MVALREFSVVELRFRLRLPVGMAMDMALLALLLCAKPPIVAAEVLVGTAGRGDDPVDRLRFAAGPAELLPKSEVAGVDLWLMSPAAVVMVGCPVVNTSACCANTEGLTAGSM